MRMIALLWAEAAPSDGASHEWYEYVAGVLAIPVALVGLVYSWVLVKKTRLESRKTELEIQEKEAALSRPGYLEDQENARTLVAQPLIDTERVQSILLRFVLIFLFLQVWGLLSGFFEALFRGAAGGVYSLLDPTADIEAFVIIPMALLQAIPRVAYWVILLGLGLPLYRDVSRELNIDVPRLLQEDPKGGRRTGLRVLVGAIVVLTALAGSVPGLW